MGVTSPDNITFPDTSSSGGFRTLMAAMATSIQVALKNRMSKGGYRYASAVDRDIDWPSGSTPTGTRTRIEADLFDREWNGSAWVPTGAGLLPIKPSAIFGTGASVVGGLVTWGGSSATVQVNDCMPGGFDGYRILLQDNLSATSSLSLGFQSAGVLSTNSDQQTLNSAGTTTTSSRQTGVPSIQLGGSATGVRTAVLDVIPISATNQMLVSGKVVDLAGGGINIYEVGANIKSIVNGLSIITGSGGGAVHAGRLEVYGYRRNVL